MDDAERLAILAEVIELTRKPRREPGEFTVVEYVAEMAKSGDTRTRETAARNLKKLAREGILTVRMVSIDGRDTLVFRRATADD